MNMILMLPAASPVALFVVHELLPTIRYIASAVHRANPRRSA